jgi:membrane fusion protein (multidrug efflux system)
MRPRSPDFSVLLAAAVVAGLTFIGAGCARSSEASSAQAKPEKQEAPPISVKLVPATTVSVPRVLTLSGTLIGAEQSRVAAGAAGKVVATHIERGSLVRKGALMVQLDARAASAMAQEAAAQHESLKVQQAQAMIDCQRTQQMFDKGAISKSDFDKAHSQCESTKWSVSAAEARRTQTAEALRDTEIRAPFTGMIVERNVTAGEYVRADSPVVTLVDVDSLRVELTVPEADLVSVHQGMVVDFRVAAGDASTPHHGKIRYIGPAVREQSRDAVVEAVVDNGAHDLRPGMFVTATMALGQQTLPGVPETAVRADGAQRHVFVNVGGRLEDRLVQLGGTTDGMVAVVTGVKPGEPVVADLSVDVRDGAKVR